MTIVELDLLKRLVAALETIASAVDVDNRCINMVDVEHGKFHLGKKLSK